MASTLELVNKQDGSLSPEQVVSADMTRMISNLYVYKQMLGPERKDEKDVIEDIRGDLTRLRWYLEQHFAFKPEVKKP
jgi:N-dimethylarginine dimethylaminohydrolase